jgi:hypothetical protein
MQTKITDTTAAAGLGNDYQNKLFEISSGQYVGRKIAIIQTSPADIKLTWSDNHGLLWSTPQTIVADAADGTCDCVITPDGHLQLVYTKQTACHLATRRLTFSGGVWSIGSEVTIYTGQCYDPTIALAPDGALWVSWSLFSSPSRTIYVKSSSDNGATWGSGPTDPGTQISEAAMSAWSRLLVDAGSVHVFYTDHSTGMRLRSRALSGGEWSSQYIIASGSGFSRHFDVAVGSDGRLGIAFDNDGLYYREYDGFTWGPIVNPDTMPGSRIQLLFQGNVPVIIFLRAFSGSEMIAMCTDRKTGTFSAPRPMDNRARPFDSVILYHAGSQSYSNVTSAAVSLTAADVFHPQSGCLLKDAGDVVFVGMDVPFRFARFNLSTPGVGGTLACSYWDGANWQGFAPVSGINHLNGSWADLLFWQDYGSIPADWQKCPVNNTARFWVRIHCTSAYSAGPVGSQVTAVSRLGRLAFRR